MRLTDCTERVILQGTDLPQEILPEPFLHVSSDHLVASGMLPARRDEHGPFSWQRIRPRFFAGFHRCLLAGLDVFLTGVHCDLEEIDRRERSRGDRTLVSSVLAHGP
jgi:chloramphenicol 3-O phosphotransferase